MSLSLVLVKIWLTSGLPLTVYANSDEKVFLLQTQGLLSGHWLGTYTGITLAKMPFYSMFLALCFLLGIPALLAQQLVYSIACGVFLIAVRPAIARWRPYQVVLLFVLLLFNPMTFLGGSRLLRNHFYASLGVLLVASALAIIIRADWDLGSLLTWSITFGIVLSAQWLTREESLWVAPFLLICTLAAGWSMWQARSDRWRRTLVLLAIPYALLAVSVLTVDGLNKAKYGVFTANELQSSEFKDVIGALYRVKQSAPRRQYVVVPKETRERIYAVSPAFAELRASLEGEVGQKWAAPSCQYYQICADNDVEYGWFVWEIRQAAAVAGHQGSAVELARFFEQIAREINAACSSGSLSCQARRSSTTPPWESSLAGSLLSDCWQQLESLATFRGFTLRTDPGEATAEEIAAYRDFSREVNITRPPDHLLVTGWAASRSRSDELAVRDSDGRTIESTIRSVPRPDVSRYLETIGLEVPATLNFGFEIVTPCVSGCYLFIKENAAKTWMKAAPLDGSVKRFQSTPSSELARTAGDPNLFAVQRGDVVLYIDSIAPSLEVNAPMQSKLNHKKLKILQAIATSYEKVVPFLCVLSLLVFVGRQVQCWRHRTLPIDVLMVWLILFVLLNRMAALAFVDVVAFRVSHSAEYVQYSYPLLLMAVGLVLLDLGVISRVAQVNKDF